jgi:hypothetical protein
MRDYLSPEAILKVKSSQFVKEESVRKITFLGKVVYKISNDCVHIWVVQILVKEDPYNYEAIHIENIYRWIIYHLERQR